MADSENLEPRSNADWFSSAMYLDQLPTVSGNMPISPSSNPYLSWLESPDVSKVAPWGTTTYWSPPLVEKSPEQTTDASAAAGPSPSTKKQDNAPPLETSVNGFAPPLTVGVQIPSMEVPGTQRVVVWKERADTAQFGTYSRFDGRATVVSNQPKPEPIDPNNPEGTFVTQTFYLSDEVRNTEDGNVPSVSPTDESTVGHTSDSQSLTGSSFPEVVSTPPLSLVDPPFNVVTDKSPLSFYTPNTATASSAEVPLVGAPFNVAETSPASFYAPFTATATPVSPEGGVSSSAPLQAFFLDDEIAYESENNATVSDKTLTKDPTSNHPDSISPTTHVTPLTQEDTAVPADTDTNALNSNWNRWNEYKISTRYEGREKKAPPQPLDPNDVSGKSSVTQAFFLDDDLNNAFDPDPALDEKVPIKPDPGVVPPTVATAPLTETLIDLERKVEPKQPTTNFVVLQDQKFMRLAIALASTE
jgi:hypothetical protein